MSDDQRHTADGSIVAAHVANVESVIEECLRKHLSTQIYIAYSGGVDSTALLIATRNILSRISAEQNTVVPQLTAIYVDHGLSPQSQMWIAHAQAVCASLGVALEVCNVDVSEHGNLEANAREARYAAFGEVMQQAGLLLLGHHQQDQTETILLRLFQGRSVQPMRASGELGFGLFMRPGLQLSRQQLQAYVQWHGVPWVEDPTNAETHLARNFIRHEVVPRLSARWQNLHSAVQRVAHDRHARDEALVHALKGLPNRVAVETLPTAPSTRLAWLRAYLATRGIFNVRDAALATFCEAALGPAHLQVDSIGQYLHLYKGFLYFETSVTGDPPASISVKLDEQVALPHGVLVLTKVNANSPQAIVYDETLEIRFRCGGERITPAKRPRQSVKNLLSEHGVLPWRRDSYPLLYRADNLVCVPGIAIADIATDMAAQSSAQTVIWVLAEWSESNI